MSWKVYFEEIFPFRLALVYPLFTLVGGGTAVISAMWYSAIADVMPVNARYRSSKSRDKTNDHLD
jgi:hypothetical protein